MIGFSWDGASHGAGEKEVLICLAGATARPAFVARLLVRVPSFGRNPGLMKPPEGGTPTKVCHPFELALLAKENDINALSVHDQHFIIPASPFRRASTDAARRRVASKDANRVVRPTGTARRLDWFTQGM
jgi:hypothetical protein